MVKTRGPRKTHIAVQELNIPEPVPDFVMPPSNVYFRQNKQTMPTPVVPKPSNFPIAVKQMDGYLPSGQNPYAPQITEFVKFEPEKPKGLLMPNNLSREFVVPSLPTAKPVPYSIPVLY